MGNKYDFKPSTNGSAKHVADRTTPDVVFQGFETSGVRCKQSEEKKENNKVGFFRLFRFADRVDYLLMIVGLLGGVGHGLGAQLNLLVLSHTLDKFVLDSRNLTSGWNQTGSVLMDDIGGIVVDFVLVATLVLVSGYLNMMCWCLTSERQIRVIRDLAFRAVLRQHMGWFDRHQSGELNTRLTSDINGIHGGIGDKVATSIQWTSTFVTGAIICLIRAWKLTLAMLFITPVGIGIAAFVAWALQSYANKELQAYATAGAVSEEALSNIRTVTSYGGHEREAKRYETLLHVARKVGVQRGLVTGIGQGLFWMVVFGSISFGFWYGAVLIQKPEEKMSVGILMQVVMSLVTGVRALSFGVTNLDNFSIARAGAAIIYGLIDSKSEIDSSSNEGKKPTEIHGTIKFESVAFAYPSRQDTLILDGLDLEVRTGHTVALVGPSGCGKSTIVQLIQRFYDPTKGKVTMDDLDLRDLNIRWLRQQIGVVSQEPVLFATSIKENIMFGRDGVTQAEIEQAAKDANAHNFIMTLPEKYDTPVGSKGGQLSGGQKQRIAIARALVRNPKILILDDATSALDYQSESVVQEALDKARQGRTTLIIAHRLSTIRNADVICAIEDGRIIEKGTHEELLALGGVYQALISRQFNEDEDDEDEDDIIYGDDDIDVETSAQNGTQPSSPIIMDYERQISKFSSSSRRSRSSTGRGSARRRRRTITAQSEKEKVVRVEEQAEPAPVSRIIKLNKPEMPMIAVGCVAAALQGAIFPAIGFFAAEILGAFGEETVDSGIVNYYVVILAICGIGAGIATFLMIFLFTLSGERLTLRLRDMAFRSMMRQEIGWFDDKRNQVGSLTSRLAMDASMVKAATGAHLSTVVNATATVILALTLAFVFGWKLALVCTAFVPLLVGTGFAQTALLVNFAKGSKASMEDGGRVISEAIENIRTVASLTKEEYFFNKFNGYFEKAYSSGQKRAQIFGITWGISQSMFFYANAASYGYGTYLVAQRDMLYEDVFRVFVSVASGAVELGRVNAFAADYTKAKVAAAKLFALFERKPLIDPTDIKGEVPRECAGTVTFQDVHFRYPTRPDAKVLQGLTVSVKPGQSLALVGSSGCGKSTTVQLLERFYDPEKGHVLVDGHDTTDVNISWLRSQIGIVAQEPMLFDTTIRENIAYGDQSRTIPDQEIITAARQANIHEFVSALPNGYDTEIGAKGVALVGGQKQRIAIARALIRNPKILLLDEATSALDTENEKVVQEALDVAQRGRTSIVIAHRLSTIENADVIAVIDNGQVAELGRHSELMAKKGLYYMLQMIQRGVKVDMNNGAT